MMGFDDFRLTKIIATLGPASAAPETVARLITEGVSVFRINFSHGTFEEFEILLATVRHASEQTGRPVAVLGDLSGPKIRVGQVVDGGVTLKDGARVEFCKPAVVTGTAETVSADHTVFSTTYPGFIEEVEPGHRVLIDDGQIRLRCLERRGDGEEQRLICEVVHGGLATTHKGVNLPDTDLSVPALTERDQRCAKFAVEHGFDFLALSFVRSADDVRQLKQQLAEPIPIIAKIEKPQAIDDLEAIVEVSAGVMVARGDLGVEIELAEVPVLQKRIVGLCRNRGKPVIIATQMLQTMIDSPTPTRAEVSDVANAIFDGVDAVMLSGETAVGKWPVESVQVMRRIERTTSRYLLENDDRQTALRKRRGSNDRAAALAHGVHMIVHEVEAKLVAVWTAAGGGPIHLSQTRLPRPIVAFSDNHRALRRMTMMYGIRPIYSRKPASTAEFVAQVDRVLREHGWAAEGDPVVSRLELNPFASATAVAA